MNDVKIPPNKIRVLSNCYDLEITTMERSIQPYLSIRKKPIIHILFMGSLKSNKGILDLIHSCAYLMRKLNTFLLHIAGQEGEKNVKSQMMDLIDQYQLNNNIELVGEVSGKDKLDLLLKSDFFILPSYIENFPVTILEAMRAALPVISTPVGAVEEIIQDGKNGYLVSPGDIHGFAQRILELMKNRRLRHYMSKNNLDEAIEKYDPYNYKTDLTLIYQTVLEKYL